MNIIKKINNKAIKSKYFEQHKTSYIIIRIVLLPIILLVLLFQTIETLADRITTLLGRIVTKLTYFIYKAIHYKNLPNKEEE